MHEIKLKMVKEVVTNYPVDEPFVNTAKEAYDCLKPLLNDLPHETMYALYLNVDNKVIGIHQVSKGTVDGTRSHFRDIFAPALLCGAVKIVVVHNHPSGCLDISSNDIIFTEKVVEASRVIDVPVVDHVIIGGLDGGYVSLRDEQKCEFYTG